MGLSERIPSRWFFAGVVVLALFPVIGSAFSSFYTLLMIDAMVFAIFALGFDLVMGQSDIISFGHAAYFGLGAYASALTLIHLDQGLLVILFAGIAASAVYAFLVSFALQRISGVYFAVITFATAQILYELALRTPDITGGFNGLSGIPDPLLFRAIELGDIQIYYFVLVLLVVVYLVVKRVMRSPLGLVFRAIKENEQRLQFVGYDVARFKQTVFVISGVCSGLAGGLFLLSQEFVSPNVLYWTISGEIIMITLVGGLGTLYGPMIGAVTVVYLENILSSLVGSWQIVLGVIFVAIIIFFPKGLVGTAEEYGLSGIRDSLTGVDREEGETDEGGAGRSALDLIQRGDDTEDGELDR